MVGNGGDFVDYTIALFLCNSIVVVLAYRDYMKRRSDRDGREQ